MFVVYRRTNLGHRHYIAETKPAINWCWVEDLNFARRFPDAKSLDTFKTSCISDFAWRTHGCKIIQSDVALLASIIES